MSRIVLATPSEQFEDRVRSALNGTVSNGDLSCWREGLTVDEAASTMRRIAEQGAEVVTVGPGLDFHVTVGLARAFDEEHPEVSVVVVAEPSARLLEVALRCGARDVVSPESSPGELRSVLERALETSQRRRSNLVGEPDAAPGRRRHVVVVTSPKGGVGKTTLATNLAVGIAKHAPKEVALVDLDLQYGDVGNALRLLPEQTLTDAVRVGSALDATTLKVFLTAHPSGVYALCGPDSPTEAEDVKPEHVERVLQILTTDFPYVVIDTGSGLDDAALAALDHATDLVVVCATDVPTVRGTRKQLETLDLIGATSQTRHVVLNRSDARVGLSADDIQKTIGHAIDVAVPSSRAVPVAVNQGTAVLESDEVHPVTKPLLELVGRFVDAPVEVKERQSLFSFRRKA